MLKANRIYVKNVNVFLNNDVLVKVKVSLSDMKDKEKCISLISSYCDINKEIIVIE